LSELLVHLNTALPQVIKAKRGEEQTPVSPLLIFQNYSQAEAENIMKTYNFTYLRSVEAENLKEAKQEFLEMFEDLSGTEIYQSGDIEEDTLPN